MKKDERNGTCKNNFERSDNIRKILNLKDSDKVAFIKRNGQYVLANPVSIAIDNARNAFKGEAEKY